MIPFVLSTFICRLKTKALIERIKLDNLPLYISRIFSQKTVHLFIYWIHLNSNLYFQSTLKWVGDLVFIVPNG